MATTDEHPVSIRDAALKELAGVVAAEVVLDLSAPIAGARDRLASVIDGVDRHVASSTGPTPYPWRALGGLRQDLAAAYFQATAAARRLEELTEALLGVDQSPMPITISEAVESGIHLASHRIADTVDLRVDVGAARAIAVRGALTLVVARAVLAVARTDQPAGNTLSILIRRDEAFVVVKVFDNGGGSEGWQWIGDQLSLVVAPWGGRVNTALPEASECGFEIRLAAER